MKDKWKNFAGEHELAIGLTVCFLVIVVIATISTAASGGLEPIQHPSPTPTPVRLAVAGLGIS